MNTRRLLLVGLLVLGVLSSGAFFSLNSLSAVGVASPLSPAPTAQPVSGDPHKLPSAQPDIPVPDAPSPSHLTHPCGGMAPEPVFDGVSPLAIAHVSGSCSSSYGDIGVWQADGHNYVALSGFAVRMFYLFNVDDPYNPVMTAMVPFPAGGTAGTSVFPFRQRDGAGTWHSYVSASMRGSVSSGGCGYYVYNVDNPSSPQLVGRKAGTDWCTVHEHFVSTDATDSADYAWLSMSNESGSGFKVVVIELGDLTQSNTMVERGRYQRPDSSSNIFIHDVNVVGNRVFVAHWGGGMLIHDKMTLVNNINPTPLNPLDSIRPASFNVHHVVPTTDGNYVFIEDEFINSASLEKVKLYNITDINNPVYIGGIIGSDTAANSQAHNLVIKPISPGRDLLLVAWYRAGTRGFMVDTTGPTPVITQTIRHQLRQTAGNGFGNVWGATYQPCTLRGQPRTCIYSGDMTYGLVVDALDYDPALDPYQPESQITSPTNGTTINTCTYTITGTAHDYYSGVASIEVSTDNGSTWQPAQGTATWTYQWNISGDGPYALKVRARDTAGNVQAPTATVNVTVAGSCAVLTPSPAPSNTPIPSSTIVPPTSTRTTIATATPTRVCCNNITATLSSVCEGSSYRYTEGLTNSCSQVLTASGALYFEVSPNENGPWTSPIHGDIFNRPIQPGYTESTGPIWSGPVPPGNNWWRVRLNLYGTDGCWTLNTATTPRPVCVVGTVTPVTATATTTIVPSATRTAAPTNTSQAPTATATSEAATNTPEAATNTPTVVVAILTPTVTPTACAINFADVPTSNDFYANVRCLACRGIDMGFACGGPGEPCNATNDRYFRVNTPITRDDLAHMVAASAGFNEAAGTRRFQDVPSTNPYYMWVQRMANRGLIGGYPCGGSGEPCVGPDNLAYYRPSANATRGQIAKIVSNGAGFEDAPQGQTFEDVSPGSTFYVWVQRLTRADRAVMGGYPCGGPGEPCLAGNRPYFRWQNNATRGQVAKITANTFFPNCQTPLVK